MDIVGRLLRIVVLLRVVVLDILVESGDSLLEGLVLICKVALGLDITVVVTFWSLLIYFCECACYCLTILSDLICFIYTSLNNWTIINDLMRLSLMDKMYSSNWWNRYYWSCLCSNNSRYKLLIYRMRRGNWHIYIMHIIIMMIDYIRLIIAWIKRMRSLIRR
jgi:hypothetical protein